MDMLGKIRKIEFKAAGKISKMSASNTEHLKVALFYAGLKRNSVYTY